jgi:fused signal recognition particle receptor
MSLFKNFNVGKIFDGLAKTREKISRKLNELFTGKAYIDETDLEKIEEILITADIGYEATQKIISEARKDLKKNKERSVEQFKTFIKQQLLSIISIENKNLIKKIKEARPYVILIVGVNGAGKTTTVGKLANLFKELNFKVLIGSADTFRAAANEQLEIWAKRAQVEILQKKDGSDPGSVAYETLQKAVKENYDIVLIDTAGRLHTKDHLMSELNKIYRVCSKVIPYAPHDVFIVIDGNVGQNAIIQTDNFNKVAPLTGIIIAKLDGTAKGGAVFQICQKFKLPVKFIGVGEGIDDLMEFDPYAFVEAIFEEKQKAAV